MFEKFDLRDAVIEHFGSVPTKQESGDSDGNRILQNQKQKLLQDSGAPDYHFY